MVVPEGTDVGVVTVRIKVPFVETFVVLVPNPDILPCVAEVVVIPSGVVHVPAGVVQYCISTVFMVPVVPVIKENVYITSPSPARESLMITLALVREPAYTGEKNEDKKSEVEISNEKKENMDLSS
jgi:hypothetical protein